MSTPNLSATPLYRVSCYRLDDWAEGIGELPATKAAEYALEFMRRYHFGTVHIIQEETTSGIYIVRRTAVDAGLTVAEIAAELLVPGRFSNSCREIRS